MKRNNFVSYRGINTMTPLSLYRQNRRFFSVEKDKKEIKVTEEKNSWSYEFGEEEIKGISFSNQSGNYVIIYTCKVCETRQSRSFTKQAYHHGVVIVRCEGCENLHLISDNLKWFEDNEVNIEELIKREGQEVIKVNADGELKEYFLNKIKERKSVEEKKEEED